MPTKNLCKPENLIATEKECKTAAAQLAIPYAISGEWKGSFDIGGCLVARDGRGKAYFNKVLDWGSSETMQHDYMAVCKKPAGKTLSKDYLL